MQQVRRSEKGQGISLASVGRGVWIDRNLTGACQVTKRLGDNFFKTRSIPVIVGGRLQGSLISLKNCG